MQSAQFYLKDDKDDEVLGDEDVRPDAETVDWLAFSTALRTPPADGDDSRLDLSTISTDVMMTHLAVGKCHNNNNNNNNNKAGAPSSSLLLLHNNTTSHRSSPIKGTTSR
jgi:hypothetical protein